MQGWLNIFKSIISFIASKMKGEKHTNIPLSKKLKIIILIIGKTLSKLRLELNIIKLIKDAYQRITVQHHNTWENIRNIIPSYSRN